MNLSDSHKAIRCGDGPEGTMTEAVYKSVPLSVAHKHALNSFSVGLHSHSLLASKILGGPHLERDLGHRKSLTRTAAVPEISSI